MYTWQDNNSELYKIEVQLYEENRRKVILRTTHVTSTESSALVAKQATADAFALVAIRPNNPWSPLKTRTANTGASGIAAQDNSDLRIKDQI